MRGLLLIDPSITPVDVSAESVLDIDKNVITIGVLITDSNILALGCKLQGERWYP